MAWLINNSFINHPVCLYYQYDTHTHTHTRFDQVSYEFYGCPTNFVRIWISHVSEWSRMLIHVHRCTVLYNTVKWYDCNHYITFMLCLYCYFKKLKIIVVLSCVICTDHMFTLHVLLESYHPTSWIALFVVTCPGLIYTLLILPKIKMSQVKVLK